MMMNNLKRVAVPSKIKKESFFSENNNPSGIEKSSGDPSLRETHGRKQKFIKRFGAIQMQVVIIKSHSNAPSPY